MGCLHAQVIQCDLRQFAIGGAFLIERRLQQLPGLGMAQVNGVRL
jgi:hypothetical protein